jgi:hypothetical protein
MRSVKKGILASDGGPSAFQSFDHSGMAIFGDGFESGDLVV